MTDVFISYARADRNRVRFIAHALTAEGFTVWWDPEIKPGAQWNAAIRKALENAACVITCWSKKSAKSQWVLAETTHAQGRQVLVPVMIQACDPPIPFNMTQSADLQAWRGDGADHEWQGVLETVRRLVEAKRRLAAAAPPPGEAYGATREAGRAAAGMAAEEPFAYTPSPRRFGPRLGQMLLGGAVVTAVLTAGVFLAPRLADRFAPTQTAASAPDAPVEEATAPAAPEAAPDATAPIDPGPATVPTAPTPTAPTPTGPTPTGPTPTSPTPVAAGPEAGLDACASRLIALCPAQVSVNGFRADGALSAREARFLSDLQIAADPPSAEAVSACEAVLERRSRSAASSRRTVFDQTCEAWGAGAPPPPQTTSPGQTQQPNRDPGLGETILENLPNILTQPRPPASASSPGRTGSASIPPGSLLDLGSGAVGQSGDVGLYSASRRVTAGQSYGLAVNDGVGLALFNGASPSQQDCAAAAFGSQPLPVASGQTFCLRRRNGVLAALTVVSQPSDNGVSVRYRVWD